jgi:hypothetical protein
VHAVSWWFFEVNTFKMKLRYASYDDAVTNTTLFIQNFTNLMITCSDVVENLYFYGVKESQRFESGTEWALGLLQSLLGSVLRITAITNDLINMGKENITDVPKTLYYCGEILNMLLVFDPVSDDLSRFSTSDVRALRSSHPSVLELPEFDQQEAQSLRKSAANRVLNRTPYVGHAHE